MYFLRKTFELAICLTGYWFGRKFGGWGGGILLAFAALVASSWGWEWLARKVFMRDGKGDARMHFIYGVMSSVLVAAAAYVLWGK